MMNQIDAAISNQVEAHGKAELGDIAKLRGLSTRQRGRLIEAACEAAAIIAHSRRAAGLPGINRDPWPASTWDFFRKQAARVRN